mgnify:CR=1 FL=1
MSLPAAASSSDGPTLRFAFGKTFHVSPFMPMQLDYDWRFSAPGPQLVVHMRNLDGDGASLFDATLTLHRREIERKFDEIVAFADVEKFIDTPVKFYSTGMYMRLAFAVAAHLEPEILVVDDGSTDQTPEVVEWTLAPPSSSKEPSSCVTLLTTSGSVTNIYAVSLTMKMKSVIAGE